MHQCPSCQLDCDCSRADQCQHLCLQLGEDEAEEKKQIDLAHLRRIAVILESLPGDLDLPHAMIALEDAYMVCSFAMGTGVSLAFARKAHRDAVTREELKQMVQKSGLH